MKETIGVLTVFLSLIALLPYIVDIFRNRTKPHVFTWMVWAVVTVLAFLGQWQKGGGPGSWTTGVTGLLTVLIAIISIKKGTKDITSLDKVVFVGALVGVIPWFLTRDPTISMILITLIDVVAFIPTIRKTSKAPQSETLVSYGLHGLRHILSVIALANYNIATFLYPSSLAIMNIIVILVILKSRSKK